MEPIFTSKLIQACITSIKVVDNYVLAGIGGNINIYNVVSATFLRRFKIFEGSKIHGIELNPVDQQLFIYSGQKMKLVRYEGEYEKFSREPSFLADDWILAAKFIDNYSRIATITMNNLLQIRNTSLEVTEQYTCNERSMLYSACIGFNTWDEIIVFAGTAFGNIFIWKPSISTDKQCAVQETLKGHKSVILSIDFNEDLKMMCSTSDDRSSILWAQEGIKHKKFEKKCKVYGHQARVFCCKVMSNFFVSAGEDSVLNIWNFDGSLLRMVEPHQGGAIRSLGYHEERNYIISGGEDGSLTSFSAFTSVESKKVDIMPKMEVPRQVILLSSGNIAVVSEGGYLLCYICSENRWVTIDHHKELEQCSLLEVSPCRKCVALIGFHGEMYFYKELRGTLLKKCYYKLETQSKIAGAHWLNCKNFLTYENEGRLFTWDVQKNSVEIKYQYTLPWNGERRLTSACLHKECLVIGDRKGHLHVYNKKEFPIRSMMKVHTSQGVSKLYSISNVVISLGRDSLLKMHRLEKDLRLTPVSADKLPFTWLGSLYKNYLVGFSGENLILWDIKVRRTLLKSSCGGGHRSWDFSENTFIYLKSKAINIKHFDLPAILPLDFISGYHVKEINCLKAIRIGGYYILISGGEDTVLRLKKVDLTKERVELTSIKKFKSHLSSIKAIGFHKVEESDNKITYLIFYGGGREQILMYKLIISVENSSLEISCLEQDSYYNNSNDVETRIMDMNVVEYNKRILLFAACSNGNIHLFKIVKGENPDEFVLKFMKTFQYKLRCLLKITSLFVSNMKMLLTMATDGMLVFWNFSEVLNNDSPTYSDAVPAHQSGINSYSIKAISDTQILILSGGDDNAVVLNLIEFSSTDSTKVSVVDTFKDVGVHCALISGAFICDKFFVTTAIDQRVLLFSWEIIEDKLKCRCLSMFHTAIADVQGMECFNNGRLDIFVYGNGLEYITSRRILSG
ncbi:hypothetical protein WA026_018153 [Henosepilachna vigintioctopunctata]|uniref:tRNA (34-2'-O)-methyltransferase regulator WDR6 n=1 Tax=Henosepilachna vigintioctopunctata TaxID=420089 RepID=A0AAW1UMC1_9CUCU